MRQGVKRRSYCVGMKSLLKRCTGICLAALALLVAILGWVPSQPASAEVPKGVLPVSGAVVGAFAPPDVAWGSGHRGVDLASAAGTIVVAPRDGVVTFAEVLAGRPVLVVSHGAVRSTFEPVEALVPVGTSVARGQPIGRLVAGHACAAASCLHWGLKADEVYLNPLSLLGGEVRLVSDAEALALKPPG